MSNTILVHVCLFIFNFLASVIQGMTGFGDAILLHVLWYTASVANPEVFNATPLGPYPVAAVALLMYVRIIFSAPLVAYLSFKDGLFSWSMTIAMAVPSTICATAGVFIFDKFQHGDELKIILGISSLIFAIMYVLVLVGRYALRQRKVRELMASMGIRKFAQEQKRRTFEEGGDDDGAPDGQHQQRIGRAADVTIHPESALVDEMAAATRNNSFASAPGDGGEVAVDVDSASRRSDGFQTPKGERSADARRRVAAATAEDDVPHNNNNDDDDDDDGAEEEVHYLSTETGSPFTRREARPRPIAEEGAAVPPLTPSKVSPTRTVTYTRVRVNRNLDENGKIKMSTRVGASVSAAFTGIMGSLTGVGAPPQIIFILLFDVPQYIIRVNFCMQSIPSAAVRFVMACAMPLFTTAMIPIFVNSLIAGYCGVFAGTRLGKMVGPNTYNVFVLCLLLLSSLIMITTQAWVLVLFTVLCTALVVGYGWWERKHERLAKVAAQREVEEEIARTQSDAAGAEHQQAAAAATTSFSQKRKSTVPALGARRGNAENHQHHKKNKDKDDDDDSSEEFSPPLSLNSSLTGRVRKADLARPPSLFTTPVSTPIDSTTSPGRRSARTTTTTTTTTTRTAAAEAGAKNATASNSHSVNNRRRGSSGAVQTTTTTVVAVPVADDAGPKKEEEDARHRAASDEEEELPQ